MSKRNQQLDLLRCAAIMGVLVAHTVNFREPKYWWDRMLTIPSWSGVDLFFVLSGFLISGLLFSEYQSRGRINFARFAIRRALKLYPTLYVLVFGLMAARLWQNHFHFAGWIVNPVLHDILFLQSYLPGTYGHFWSLAVEEHFYILLPVTLFLMLRRAGGEADPFRRIPSIFLRIAVLCLALRLVHAVLVQPYDYFTHLFPTHFRLDSLLFGVLLCYWSRFHAERFRRTVDRIAPFLLPVSLLLILPSWVFPQQHFITYTVGLTFLYLGYGGVMIALLRMRMPTAGLGGALLKPLSYIGQHSYPIYVFHLFVLERLQGWKLLNGAAGLVLYFAASIVFGIVFSKLIEFPVLRLRDRIFPAEVALQPPGIEVRPRLPEWTVRQSHARTTLPEQPEIMASNPFSNSV